MDNLISGLTKLKEPLSGTDTNPAENSNTGNTGNSRNNVNTDKKSKPQNSVLSGNTNNRDNTESAGDHETRFCTIVDVNNLRKIRIIANREGLLIKDVVGAAFTKAISSYEAKHGPIEGDLRGRADNLF